MLTTGLFSCGQDSKTRSKPTKNAASNSISISRIDKGIYSQYEYTDSLGKRLIFQNSFPKGERYTDPHGKSFLKLVFWSQIMNETDHPLELKIDFPVDAYYLSSSSHKYFRILIPSDTMILDNEPLYHNAMTGLNAFLDKHIHKPTSIKRMIKSKESSGLYFVILYNGEGGGPFRTGLSLKGQNLFYKVSQFEAKPAGSLIDEKEVKCGSIHLKNLILKK